MSPETADPAFDSRTGTALQWTTAFRESLSHGLVGRHREVSASILLTAPIVALASAVWVGQYTAFGDLHRWALGTWYGTDPQLTLLYVAGALLVLGAASAAINSGVLPTTLLVAAPLFGAGATSYGHLLGEVVVSLPVALGIGGVVALGIGVPLGVFGFGLGVALRRAMLTIFDGVAPTILRDR